MQDKFQELKRYLFEINDLQSIGELLSWDQSVCMPSGGGESRAHQMATLGRLVHEKFTDPQIGRLLEDLYDYETSLPYESDEASLIRIARRDYEKAIRVTADFKTRLFTHLAQSYQVWERARPANDFVAVQPYLEQTLDLSREYAAFFPGYEHIADPLIDARDNGMKAASLRVLFAKLREQLVPILREVTSQPVPDCTCLHQVFPEAAQLAFGIEVIKQLGYDSECGRQDKAPHPFTTRFSLGDVRITTRVREDDFSEAFFSTVHETGHAMYHQNARGVESTLLEGAISAGLDESQAILWENLVARSKSFWLHFFPKLQRRFPNQLDNVSLDQFYRAINKVQLSLIRTEADEVTYNMHVIMRFDFELDLLEGKLAVRDLPEAWRERFKADFGIVPPDDRDGVLQDAHWFDGLIGGQFQGYTIGSILSAQLFEAAVRAHPKISREIETGDFGTLRNWLKENIYQHGRKYTAPELIERVTGKSLEIESYIRYLREKYRELYNVEM